MGFLGRSASDHDWVESARPVLDAARGPASDLSRAIRAEEIEQQFQAIRAVTQLFPSLRDALRQCGSPTSAEARRAKKSLELALKDYVDGAMQGQKLFSDLQQGLGDRAVSGGFAGRAAVGRVAFQRGLYEEIVKKAEGRLAAAIAFFGDGDGTASNQESSSTTESYSSGGPTLATLFLEAAQSGLVEELRRSKQIPLSQLAMLGGWCYSRAAILGMLVASGPLPFVALVWDQSRVEKFWEFAKDEVDRIDALDLSQSAGLGYVRMQTGYPDLYGDEAMSLLRTGDRKAIEKLASSKRSLNEVTSRLAMDIASGLGVGLQRPSFVRERLESEANPDPTEWASAYEAGLDIPSTPDSMSADEQIGIVVELCRRFFEEFYPDAYEVFNALASEFASVEDG